MTKKEKLVYCAGLLDGEGCFSLARRSRKHGVRFEAYVSCAMTQIAPLKMLKELFGGHLHTYSHKGSPTPMHQWRCSNTTAANVGRALLPYLQIKNKQAQILIDFDDRPKKQRRILTKKETNIRYVLWKKITGLNGHKPIAHTLKP